MSSTTKNTSLGKVKTKTPSPTTAITHRTEKEKTRTPSSAPAPLNNETTQGRRTTKPIVSRSSSSKGLGVSSDKGTPNYLKSTASSAKDLTKNTKKESADDTGLKYSSRRQSIEKPPSPAQLKRTLSSSPKERRLTSPSPPPKKTISPKPVLERRSKTPPINPEKSQPFKLANIKKSASASTTPRAKRGSKPSSTASTPTPSSPEADESVVVKPEVEDKVAPVKEIHLEPIEAVEQVGQVEESFPSHDQTCIDAIATDISKLPEEPEVVVTKTPTEEACNEVAENEFKEEKEDKEEEEEESIKEENPTTTKESEVEDEVKEGKDESENNMDIASPSKEREEKADQVEEKEVEKEGEINGGRTESQNMVLKRQDTQGKRGSPAYNNVIEETASKLVQKRKGKVLALVGAFETVINLESDNQQSEGA